MFTHPVCFFGPQGPSAPTLSNTLGLDPSEFQRARLTDSTDFNFTTQYTFLVWVYPTDLSIENGIYNQFGSSLNFVEFSILSNGKMNFRATYGGTPSIDLTSDVTLSENNLYMIGFEITGSNVDFIINGFYDTNSGSFSVSPTDLMADLDLGRVFDGTTSFFFNGGYSLPMAFQESLNPVTVSTIYNSGIAKQPSCYDTAITDLYAFSIPLNDGVTAGQELIDVSGNGNNAFLFGTPTPVYDGEAQEIIACGALPQTFATNTALLDGSTTYFTAGDVLNVGTNDYSYVAWFKTTASATQMIISKTDATAGEAIDCFISSSGTLNLRCQVDASNFRDQSTTTTYNDGNWHLVVAFCNRSTGTWHMRVDDVNPSLAPPFSSGVITGNADNNAILSVGQRDNGASRLVFDGSLGFAGIAIGSSLVDDSTELYNAGVATCFSDLSAPIKAKFTSSGDFWELANWTGHTGGELTGQANANTLTNTGPTPFTGTGLDVECNP